MLQTWITSSTTFLAVNVLGRVLGRGCESCDVLSLLVAGIPNFPPSVSVRPTAVAALVKTVTLFWSKLFLVKTMTFRSK